MQKPYRFQNGSEALLIRKKSSRHARERHTWYPPERPLGNVTPGTKRGEVLSEHERSSCQRPRGDDLRRVATGIQNPHTHSQRVSGRQLECERQVPASTEIRKCRNDAGKGRASIR